MKFQVLLPTYNASRWFAAALQSVATHPLGEVLVIDDGSRDEERVKIETICKRYPSARFVPRPHEGLVGALNYGLSIATAPYVARMDADDITMKDRFDLQLAYLDQNPDIAVVGGQMTGIDESGQVNGLKTNLPIASAKLKERLISGKSPFIHPSVMMRREAVLRVGGYRVAAEYSEDYDLWQRLSEHYNLANLSEPVLFYRRHGGQITRRVNWRQKLAHDLGTISAERRRAGKPDPLDEIQSHIDIGNPNSLHDAEIRELVTFYQVLLRHTERKRLTDADYHGILEALDGLRFGASSKSGAKAAIRFAKTAFSSRSYRAGMTLLLKALKVNPVLALSELLKSNS